MTPAGQEYRILACIGRGGFGEVYHAQKIAAGGFRKDVALKMLNAEMASVDDVASRLKDEARILGLLNHRAIVKVDLLARLNERWTVVMEYVEGADLKDILKVERSTPLFVALEIGAEVASALDYAYNHELVDPANPSEGRRPLHLLHRDIKPSNIQITPHGDVKVLDFGIARAEFDSREAVTRTNFYLTREYAAPERLRGVEHPGGDIFSLGAALYELITGQRLDLLGPMMDALLQGQLDFHPGTYRDARMIEAEAALMRTPGITHDLVEWLLGMLAWDPDQRPEARQLKNTLRRFAALTQQHESLSDWSERVVRPLVEERRQQWASAAARAQGRPGMEGRTLVTDGRNFRLLPAETDVDRPQLLDLDGPTSADSIERTRWESQMNSGGFAATGRAPPGGDAEQRASQPTLQEAPAPAEQPPSVADAQPGSRPARVWPVLALGLLLLVGGGLGFGVLWILQDRGREAPPVAALDAPEPPGQPDSTVQPAEEPPPPDDATPLAPESAAVKPRAPEPQAAPPATEATARAVEKPRPPPQATVTLKGDATLALLQGAGGLVELSPGTREVAPGTYTVRARWSEGETSSGCGALALKAEQRVEINCVKWTGCCRWQ
ncbi:MAG: serine/threonine protein kinase [Alphaproteobacteria bacterium]|nr:serine/threonine protein kinase [Alphaproteobacteria bacterium]